jgi:class 3 adenylate cyclase/predicted ATPase
MFCDLVDSTPLSQQLDPEDLRGVIRAYQETCAAVIQRFDGYIARYMGDGLLVYFGYPQAHENDAQRAGHAGLGIVEAVGRLNTRLEREHGVQLAVRIGIHTGLVVIETIGAGLAREHQALGETPNIAARLQMSAQPNTVMISAATHGLIQGYFACHDLGSHTLKGMLTPLQRYHVLGESGAQSRLDIVASTGFTPLVGREAGIALLSECWQRMQGGAGHVVVLTGEAGIGKSRLLRVLKEQVGAEPHLLLECRCSPYHQNSALYPLIRLFERIWEFGRDTTPEEKLQKLETALERAQLPLHETVPLFANLLSLSLPDGRYTPPTLAPQLQRQLVLASVQTLLLELASHHPTLLIVEDLHWIDPTTLELLDQIIDQGVQSRLLTLLTHRPSFQRSAWRSPHVTYLPLPRLTSQQVEQLAQGFVGGKTLPDEVLRQLVARTDGVPLFVEEMAKMVLESGVLLQQEDHYELVGTLPSTSIPSTLQDLLMARLDQLASAKPVAQLGATLGRSFSYELLREVSQLDEATLEHQLRQLVGAELLYQRGAHPHATYGFKHALIQDAAYHSLLRSTRQQYHQRIAEVLEARFTNVVTTQPELLAHHYTTADRALQAIPYWLRAAQNAIQRSAHVEAIGHLSAGLALIPLLPDAPERTQYELTLQLTSGNALVKMKGYGAPEVEQAYARARALCQELGDPRQLMRVLYGLWVFYHTRAEFKTAYELAEQLLQLARQQRSTAPLLLGHNALGSTLFFLGEFARAQDHLTQGIALEMPQSPTARLPMATAVPRVANFVYMSWTLWFLGYPDQALARGHEALALAHEQNHPFNRAMALYWTSFLHQLRQETHEARERAEAAMALSTAQGFTAWVAGGTLVRGWALVVQGQVHEGMAQIRQGLNEWRATGAELARPSGLAKLAEAYRAQDQPEEGLRVLAEALEIVDATDMGFYEAELYRLKGTLQLQLHAGQPTGEAEASFRRALDIARHQTAKSLELRAAMSLARLWQQQGKRGEARQLLGTIYSWFTEGFDTADLGEAKTLLDELSG